MKPLIRWTIGNAAEAGFEALKHSLSNWKRCYGDTFDMAVCYNGISEKKLQSIADIDVTFVDQTKYLNSIVMRPHGCTWKLFPPRLRPDSHEIFIDNDLIVYNRLPDIEKFLSGNYFCITQAHMPFFGQYEGLPGCDIAANTGLFGVPPSFDFAQEINMLLRTYPYLKWRDHSDDQGVVMVATRNLPRLIIPLTDIWVCNPCVNFAPYRTGFCGVHFASLNSGSVQFWERYKRECVH